MKDKKVYGIGTNDVLPFCDYDDITKKAYTQWTNMLERCYCEPFLKRKPAYRGCSVCDEWLTFSNFLKWHKDNYVKDWQLDKDILVKGNKVYSAKNCCFVPKEINKLITKANAIRGKLPIGVRLNKRINNYEAYISKNNRFISLGCFKNYMDAFNAYKIEKENYIKEKANKYKGIIDDKVYNVLINYEVEITD